MIQITDPSYKQIIGSSNDTVSTYIKQDINQTQLNEYLVQNNQVDDVVVRIILENIDKNYKKDDILIHTTNDISNKVTFNLPQDTGQWKITVNLEVIQGTETNILSSDSEVLYICYTQIQTPPTKPILEYPENNQTIDITNNPTITFKWSKSTQQEGNHVFYDFYIGTSPSSLSRQNRIYDLSNTEFTYSLEQNTTYYWKVVQYDSLTSTSSDVYVFSTITQTQEPYNSSGKYLWINGQSNNKRGVRTKTTIITDEPNVEQIQTYKIQNQTGDGDPLLKLFNDETEFSIWLDDEHGTKFSSLLKNNGTELSRKIQDISYNSRLTWNKYVIKKLNNQVFSFKSLNQENQIIFETSFTSSTPITTFDNQKIEVSNHNNTLDGYWDYVFVKKQVDNELEIIDVSDSLPQVKKEKYILIINNPNDYDLYNYQIRIDLLSLNCDVTTNLYPTYNNIKFYDEMKNPIPHWVEHDINGNNLPYVWVKIPYLKQNQNTKIYLETTNEMDNGDGNQVFEFFDDFSTLDLNKWIVNRYSNDTNNEQVIDKSLLWLVKKSKTKGQNIIQRNFRVNNTDKYKIGMSFFIDYVCGTSNDGDGLQVMIDGDQQNQMQDCYKGFSNDTGMWVVVFDDGYSSTSQENGIQISSSRLKCLIKDNTGIKDVYRLQNKKQDLSLFSLQIVLDGSNIKVNYENRYPTPSITDFTISSPIWVTNGNGFFGIGQGQGGNSGCSNSTSDSGHSIDYVYIQKYQDEEPTITKCSLGENYTKKYTTGFNFQHNETQTYEITYDLSPFEEYILNELKKYKGLYIFNDGNNKEYNLIEYDLSTIDKTIDQSLIINKFNLINPSDNVMWYQKLDDGKVLYCKLQYPNGQTSIQYEMGVQDISDINNIQSSSTTLESVNLINEFGSQNPWELVLNKELSDDDISTSLTENNQYIKVNNTTQEDLLVNLMTKYITVSPNTNYFIKFSFDKSNIRNLVITFYNDKLKYISSSSFIINDLDVQLKFTTPENTKFIKINVNRLIHSGEVEEYNLNNFMLVNLDKLGELPSVLKEKYNFDRFTYLSPTVLKDILPYTSTTTTFMINENGEYVNSEKICGELQTGEYIVPLKVNFRIHKNTQYIYLYQQNHVVDIFKTTSLNSVLFDKLYIMLGIPNTKTGKSQILLENTQFIPIYQDKSISQFEFVLENQYLNFNSYDSDYQEFDNIVESNIPQKLKTIQEIYPYRIQDDDNEQYLDNIFFKNVLINYSWRIPILDKVTKYTNLNNIRETITTNSTVRYDNQYSSNIENYIWRQLTPFYIRKMQYDDETQIWTLNVRTFTDYLERIYNLTDRFGDLFHPYDNDMYIKRTFYNQLNDFGLFKEFVKDVELNTKIYIFLSLEFYKYISNYFVQRGTRQNVSKILDHQFKNIGQILQMFVVKYNQLSNVEVRSYQSTIEKEKFMDYFNNNGKYEVFEKQKIQIQDKYPHLISRLKNDIILKLKQRNEEITDERINEEVDKVIENQVYRNLIVVLNRNNLKTQDLLSQIEKFFGFISDNFLPQNMDILYIVVDYDTTYLNIQQIEDYMNVVYEPLNETFFNIEGDDSEWI